MMVFRHIILAIALMLSGMIAPAMAQGVTPQAEAPRVITELSTGWRFRFGGDEAGVTAAGYDDSGWEQVAVPHTWNRIGEYALTRSAVTNNAQGVGWYRLNYNAPAAAKGRRQYLDFAAVAIIADVWVNGTHVGQHKGAFSRFRFDVTSAWKPGAANLIVVRADNSKPTIGSTTQDVLPLAGDFFIHGGLYRGVSLITASDVGIDLLDMGGPGVYANPGNAWLSGLPSFGRHSVKTKLRNASGRPRNLVVSYKITTAKGEKVDTYLGQGNVYQHKPVDLTRKIAIKSGEAVAVVQDITTDVLGEWDGVKSPTQYVLTVDVSEKGQILDRVVQPFAVRSIRFDANTGAVLSSGGGFNPNEHPIKLHGVSRHQDRFGKGYALSPADHAEDMALIKEMGANAVRMAHYQHADEWVEEADKAGMLVWAEVPYVTTPTLAGGEGNAETFANAEQQLRELIRQNYNHPSIVMWSIGNEVDASSLFGLGGGATKPLALLKRLQQVAKEEDPSRPTVFADCCEDVRSPVAGLEGQVQTEKLAGTADLIGYNRYYGWYYPQPLKAREQLAAQMDAFHTKHPTLPLSISEYGAGGAISQHSDNVLAGFVNAIGRPQPEEYQSWVHEQSWPVIRDRPYIWGSFVWNMFDFASDLRNEGDSVDINTKGLVSYDRQVKKDAFYYYQAQWSDKPMIHITGKRYTDRPYPALDVRAYSNAPAASLMVNGKSIGEAPCPDHICVWPGVLLQPGENTVTATISVGSQMIADTVSWNGPDAAKGIRVDAGDLSGRLLGARRFGSDTFFTGGSAAVLNQGGFGGRRSGALKTVIAPDPSLYDYWREGDAFSYAIPLPDGKWTVTIHSFEPRTSASAAQMMSVMVGGKPALAAYNVEKAAGGSFKGVSRSFPVTVKGGLLKLDFSATNGKAVVAAIEVTK